MLRRSTDAKVDRLLRSAYRCLDRGKADRALELAARLEALHNSGSAEIRGRAQWMLGDRDGAIRTLYVGTQRWPQVAILWSYLGEFLSETGAYDAALDAFERARDGLGGSLDWSDYNCSLVLWRMGCPDDALKRVQALLSRLGVGADPAPLGTSGTFADSLLFRRYRRSRVLGRRTRRYGEGPPPASCRWVEALALIDLSRAEQAVAAMEFVLAEHDRKVSGKTMRRLLETYGKALRLAGRGAEADDLDQRFRALFKSRSPE